MNLIFTYGTLLSGMTNHYLLGSSRFIAKARTNATYKMISLGGFPGVLANGHTQIVGEVYEVDSPTLAKLDRLERHPDWYLRTPLVLEDGLEAEIYIYPTSRVGDFPVVESGNWREYANHYRSPLSAISY